MDINAFLDNKKKRQDTAVSKFGFDDKPQQSSEQAVQKIKEEADKTKRNRYWFAEDMRDSITWIFWDLWDLAEYGWTYVTNKNEDWWINDFKKYNEYSKKMTESKSEEEYAGYYKKMIDEWIINENKYNAYLDDKRNDKDYAYTQAKEEWKNVFNNKFESALSPIIKQATNRYQIDAISKWIKQIEDQYSMAFENAMNTYNDTRDTRVLDEWLKVSKEYEDNITKVTEEWAKKIIEGKTYWDAYSETINDAINKQAADKIVSLERHMTDKIFDYTIDRNFNDANEYMNTWQLLQSLNSTLLWAKNYLTWWLKHAWYWLEELKEWVTGRYDVTEELANLYVFDENASWITKTLWWAKWVGNWLLDSLPQYWPGVIEILLTRKLPWKVTKWADELLDASKVSNLERVGSRRISRLIWELSADNLVYDEAFQALVWHPITGEEENINLMFNFMIDWAQSILQAPAKFFNNALRPEDIMDNRISANALAIAKKLDDKNLNLLTEELVLLRWQELIEWSSANKALLENFFDLEELRKTAPELVEKYEKIQKQAYDYADRIRNNLWDLNDYMLSYEVMKWSAGKDKNVLEKVAEVAQENIKRWETIKQLGDYIFSGAKSISQTFKNALADGRITEADLRLSVKSVTNREWVDDLILWLAKWDATLRQIWLDKIEKSWKQMTKQEVNQIYNWTIVDLLEKKKWDILREDEWLWSFKKNSKWQYVDVYWLREKEGNYKYKPYTFEEVMDYIKRNSWTKTIWADKFKTFDSIAKAHDEMAIELANWGSAEWVWDATEMFKRLDDFGFIWFKDKPVAEQQILREMLTANGFKMNLDENKNIVSIELPYENLDKLYNRIQWLAKKWLHQFWKEDVDAYKMLFFWDIYNSFKSYANDVKLSGGNVKEFKDSFQTYFEKQFDIKDGKYTLKWMLQYDDEAFETFKDLFANNASFKEIENEAANNLIKNILKEADNLDINDDKLYRRIEDLVIKGHYLEVNKEKALPIVNSLFNQAKWMKSLWMWDAWINEIVRVFWELIIDWSTIKALSNLNSDYLYKTIISKLVLENDLWAGVFRDWMAKMLNKMWTNLSEENKEIIESLSDVSKRVNKLTSKWIPQADKVTLLNKIQDAFEHSKVKAVNYSKRLNKWWVTNKNWIYVIKDAKKLTNESIDNLSTMMAINIFHRNNLPNSRLLDKLKNGIANTLENLRVTWGNLEFSLGQWLKESKWVLNLSLLWDIQLAQLLKDPDNMMQTIIAKWQLQKSFDWVEELARKTKLYDKIWIWEAYSSAINWLKGLISNGYDKSNVELIRDVIRIMEEKWLTNRWNVVVKLTELYKKISDKSIAYKTNIVWWQLSDDIDHIEKLINLMNIPGNPKEAERVAQELYNVKQLLERAEALIFNKADLDDFEKSMNMTYRDLKQLERPSYINFNWIVSTSKTVQDVWNKWTNEIFVDTPYHMKWKGMQWKKFVILDTETSWLPEELEKLWHKPEIIQLAYRVIEVWEDWVPRVIDKQKSVYKLPKWNATTKWAKDNYDTNVAPYFGYSRKQFNNKDKLFKNLQDLANEEWTYFVWHNVDFDIDRLKDAWIKLSDNFNDKVIATDLVSSALLPLWTANHTQEALTKAFEPINDAINKIKYDEWLQDMIHHNAVVDTAELDGVIPYLINHALKNKKTTEDWLLDFLVDTTKKLREEHLQWKFSANATPFYHYENNWSYQNMSKSRNIRGTADWTYDMPYLLTQMFGSNAYRWEVSNLLEEFETKFWAREDVLNVHDVINSVADKLWDERSLYILHSLKDIVWPDAVIETNKVLLWDEVKEWYKEILKAKPDMTFPEYCTNRLVANILWWIGMYNEWTINSLNRILNDKIQTITVDKLTYNWVGSLDTSAFVKILERLQDEWLINLWTKNSTEYHNSIQKILEKLRWTNLSEPVEVREIAVRDADWNAKFIDVDKAKWERELLTKPLTWYGKDALMFPLSEFNKALSEFIKNWDEDLKTASFAAKDLLHQLFWKETKQWDTIVFEWWVFPEFMVKETYADMVWEYSRTGVSWELEEDVLKWIPDIEWVLKSKREELGLLEKNNRTAYLKDLKEKLDANQISTEEYSYQVKRVDVIMKERYNKMETLKEEITDIENAIKNEDWKNRDWHTEEAEDMNVMFEWVEKDVDEKWLSQPILERPEVKEEKTENKAEVKSKKIEWQSAVDAMWIIQESSLESRFTSVIESMLKEEDFLDNLYWKAPLEYNPLFLVDESTNSTKNYINTSYNWIVDMLSYWKEWNKDEIISFLKDKYKEVDHYCGQNEKKFNDIKETIRTEYDWDKSKLKEKDKNSYFFYQDYLEKNTKKNFLYNSIATLEWTHTSLTPDKLSDLYGFNKNLIWAQTNNWVIESIDINLLHKNWELPIFWSNMFWWLDFDREGFISHYLDLLEKWWFIKIGYTMKWSDWTKPITQKIRPENLFDTSFGKYILEQFDIPASAIPVWEYDKTLAWLSFIKKKILSNNKDMQWSKFRVWDENWKEWPRYKWNKEVDWVVKPNKDVWVEWINYSEKKYDYVYACLDDNLREELDILLNKQDLHEYIEQNGTRWIDEIVKKAWYNDVWTLIYDKIIYPAAKEWEENMTDWWAKSEIKNMMTSIVKDDTYKEAVDRVHSTANKSYYKLDNYLFKNDKSSEYTAMIDKILSFTTTETKNWVTTTYKVIGYEPQFYQVSKAYEVDPSMVLKKEKNWEWLPDDVEDLWKEYIDIVYPGIFVSSKNERSDLLRQLDAEWWFNTPYWKTRSSYRDTFEYVHDMDEVKVLVEDWDGNLYEWILEITRFQKTVDNWEVKTIPGQFQLKWLIERDKLPNSNNRVITYKDDWTRVAKEENLWYRASYDDVMEKPRSVTEMWEHSEVNVWNPMQLNWKDSANWLTFKEVKWKRLNKTPEEIKEIEEQSSIVKFPENVKEDNVEVAENLDKDWDIILEVNPLKEKDKQIWNTRLLNFTNYDLVNQSDDLQQIVWLRSFFISQHWEDLRAAVDEFNEIIKNYSPEEQEKIYNAIRNKARQLTNNIKSSDRKLNRGDANMVVNWMPKEMNDALNKIGKVFYDWWWNPQYQFLMLSKDNDWFEWILKNIWHNHKWAAVEYLRATWDNLNNRLRDIVKMSWVSSEKQIKNAVSDIVWDPLGTWTMNKMLMSVRSLWRFVKYWPLLFPLSGVMMLANSAVLWVMRYGSESKWFRWLMNTDAFNILTAHKWDTVKLKNWKTAVWLWFTDSLNRANEIMFNSNSDLWGSWFDKVLDLMISPLPEGNLKKVVTTAMKWGTHSLFDIAAQWSVKSMEFAKALEKNLVWWWSIDDFIKWVENWTVSDEMIRKILADTEKWYSRFFTNSATTLFSRHKFSRLYIFNALQWYVINRTDEIFSSIKDAVNWIGKRGGDFRWDDFTNYLQYDNQELKGFLMNVLLSAKLGFYMDRLANGWDFNAKEYSDYMVDTSDYLSSLPATFFYWILTAPLEWVEDYAEYVKMNNEDFSVWDWLTVAGLNTISEVASKFFREGKVLNAMMDSVVAFGKTGNIDFAYDVLENEFSNIANWLWRFQLAEWTHKYWLDYMTDESDMIGRILFNSDKTSNAGQLSQKLYSLQTVDWILNWENWDWWKNRLLPYVPLVWQVLQNSITGQWFTFTQAKWDELQHIMDKDPTVKLLNNWDLSDKEYGNNIRWDSTYSNDAVERMYKELTAFDYPNKARKNWTEFVTWYEWELEILKETVFTDEILRWLWWEEKDLMGYLNSAGDRKQAGLNKIMAAAEASRPGSSKIVISYLANKEEYELMQKVTGNKYPNTKDLTEEEMSAIQRQVLQDYYPYMFVADKTSWYKAITEYVSWKYDVFKDLYKDDDLTWYLSTLWYMDMIMYQQAREWNVNAKYIKNSWTMLSKYMKDPSARINAIDYIMHTIENSWFSRWREASAKMWVLAANMDFYDKIQKSGMMNTLYWDDIERYNWFVWWVLKDINKQWLNLSTEKSNYSWNKYYKPYKQGSWLWDNNVPMAQKFVPAAQKYLDWWTPSGWVSAYKPNTYTRPKWDLDFYWNYYEALIKDYSDRLVKQRSKTYPAEYTEPLTYKREQNNYWSIRAQQLVFPKHKSKEYRTNVISNLPGAHG